MKNQRKHYGEYLKLDKVLNAQHRGSFKPGG